MGCADGSGDCNEVLQDVWAFLDNEMDSQHRAVVQEHLDDCSPCLEETGLTLKLKALLASKCGGDRAPEELRERLSRLCAESVTVTRVEEADGSFTETTVVPSTVISTAEAVQQD